MPQWRRVAAAEPHTTWLRLSSILHAWGHWRHFFAVCDDQLCIVNRVATGCLHAQLSRHSGCLCYCHRLMSHSGGSTNNERVRNSLFDLHSLWIAPNVQSVDVAINTRRLKDFRLKNCNVVFRASISTTGHPRTVPISTSLKIKRLKNVNRCLTYCNNLLWLLQCINANALFSFKRLSNNTNLSSYLHCNYFLFTVLIYLIHYGAV